MRPSRGHPPCPPYRRIDSSPVSGSYTPPPDQSQPLDRNIPCQRTSHSPSIGIYSAVGPVTAPSPSTPFSGVPPTVCRPKRTVCSCCQPAVLIGQSEACQCLPAVLIGQSEACQCLPAVLIG
eukprot:1196171-Prorocentrum_minimum.AAC.1